MMGVLVSLDMVRWVVFVYLLGLCLVVGIGYVSGFVVLERWVGCWAAGV